MAIEAEATAGADLVNADLQTLARLNVQIRKAGEGTATYAQVADERDRLLDEIGSKVGIDVTFDNVGAARVTLSGSNGKVLLEDARAGQVGVQRATDGRIGFLVSNSSGRVHLQPSERLVRRASGCRRVSSRPSSGAPTGSRADFADAINGWSVQGLDANGRHGYAPAFDHRWRGFDAGAGH